MTTKSTNPKNAGTYSKILVHIIFAVKGRESLIEPEWEEQLFQYTTGIVINKGQKLLAINGTKDHIHMLIALKPACCISDLVREIKKATNAFINENKLTPRKFSWQNGFGVFSCGHSQMERVIRYIHNQKNHHQQSSFEREFIDFLRTTETEYDERFLFDWIDPD